MFSTLPRYVFWEVAKAFFFGLIVLTAMLILMGVVREAVTRNLPLVHAGRLIPYLLPDVLRFALPITLLLAVTNVYSRLAGNNEITAIRAMGISPWSVIWPVLIGAVVLSFVAIWLNDVAVSWGQRGVKRVAIQSMADIVYGVLRTQRQFGEETDRFSIRVQEVRGDVLVLPRCTLEVGGKTRRVEAAKARLYCDAEKGVMTLELTNGEIDDGRNQIVFPDTRQIPIPLDKVSNAGNGEERPADMAMGDIPGEIVSQQEKIRRLDRQMAATAAMSMSFARWDDLNNKWWLRKKDTREEMVSRLNKLNTEPHRRQAAGFSCLLFIWIGIPIAIRRRSSDFLTSFFVCFLPVLILYYPMLIFGLDAAKNGMLPPWCVWCGNAVFLIAGGWMMWRVVRR